MNKTNKLFKELAERFQKTIQNRQRPKEWLINCFTKKKLVIGNKYEFGKYVGVFEGSHFFNTEQDDETGAVLVNTIDELDIKEINYQIEKYEKANTTMDSELS